jgi:transcriptional regulator with XRE-family HTH domain
MDQNQHTTCIKLREYLGLYQQNIADLAGIDVGLVEQYEKGELSSDPHKYEQLVGTTKYSQHCSKLSLNAIPRNSKPQSGLCWS